MSRRQSLCLTLGILLLAVAVRAAPHFINRIGQATPVRGPQTRQAPGTAADKVPYRHPQQSMRLRIAALAAEALLLGAMLYWALRSPLVGATFGPLPVPYRAGAAALVTALAVGLVGGTDRTFPFVAWRMYAGDTRRGDVRIVRFVGTAASGRSARLDFDEILPALGSQRLYQSLAQQSVRIQREMEPARRDALWNDHRAILQILGRLYNRRHPDDPLGRIAVWTATLPRDELGRRPAVAYRELWSIDVD